VLVLAAVIAGLACTALPASAETGTGGYTILPAGSIDGQVHHCEVIGSADGYQAVICASIQTGSVSSSSDYAASGSIDVYCQTDAGVKVQCANIYAEGAFANGAGGLLDTGSYACGHTYGACSSQGKLLGSGTYELTASSPACYESTGRNDVWMDVYGGNTQIELPVSDETFELDATDGGNDGINYSTGHYLVCP
jgi:hypothetical protein